MRLSGHVQYSCIMSCMSQADKFCQGHNGKWTVLCQHLGLAWQRDSQRGPLIVLHNTGRLTCSTPPGCEELGELKEASCSVTKLASAKENKSKREGIKA